MRTTDVNANLLRGMKVLIMQISPGIRKTPESYQKMSLEDSSEKEQNNQKRGMNASSVNGVPSTCWILLQPNIKGQLICLWPWCLQTRQILCLKHTEQSCHTLLEHHTLYTCCYSCDLKPLWCLNPCSLGLMLLFLTLMADMSQSYHGAEGMPQEDGVSIQKSLVPAALCCL